MADTTGLIPDLDLIAAANVAALDMVEIVDVSDATHSAEGSSRRFSPVDLIGLLADPAGSAATVQGNLDTHTVNAAIHFTEGSIDHTAIQNIGTNTHAQIDTHIAATNNPHSVTAAQAGAEPDLGTPAQDGYILSSTVAGARSWIAPATGGSSPLTTKGDVYTYDTDDARLPVGTDGQFLSADSAEATGLKWVAAPSGASPLTTKGDLFGYSTADARIPVGTNGQVLTADSSEATGVKWETPSGGSASWIGTSDAKLWMPDPTDGATIDTGLVQPSAELDDTTVESFVIDFGTVGTVSGTTWQLDLYCNMVAATTGNLELRAYVWATANGEAAQTENYGAANAQITAVPGTAGTRFKVTITLTNDQSLGTGLHCKVRVDRNTATAGNAVDDVRIDSATIYKA